MSVNLFVVGTTRSGTSALRNALTETRYTGHGEGHTIGLLGALYEAIERNFEEYKEALKFGTMLADWKRDLFWKDIVNAYVRQIRLQFPGGFYLDKTPNILPLKYAKLIEASLDGSRFIFCRRRGIDNIISKQRKWPDVSFHEHCTEWSDIIEHWDRLKGELKSPILEIDFYEMFAERELLATRIADFLELPEDERARFYEHLVQTQPAAHPWVPLSQSGWSDEKVRTFLDACRPVMDRYNYGLESYWAAR